MENNKTTTQNSGEIDNPELSKDFDVGELIKTFDESVDDLLNFQKQSQINHETMVCYWQGQTRDQRKWSASKDGKVFPFPGSSDIRVPFIENYVRCSVAKFMEAFRRMRVVAYPLSSEQKDIRKSHYASAFIKFIVSQVKEFYDEAEKAANDYFRYGLCITYVCWESFEQSVKKLYTADDMPIELAQFVMTDGQEEMAVDVVMQLFPNITKKQAVKAVRDMRLTGKAEVVEIVKQKNRGCIRTLSPVEDIFFPASTTDIQKSPVAWMIDYKTPEEMKRAITDESWDEKFVDEALKHIGVDSLESSGQTKEMKSKDSGNNASQSARCKGLVQIIYAWQRKIDEDGAVGIYLTPFHPMVKDLYAKRDLIDYEHGMYPFIATKRERWSPRLYDTRGYPEIGFGFQSSYKALMDSAFNAESLTTLKPMQRKITTGILSDSADVDIAPLSILDVITHDQYKAFEISSEPTLNIKMREDITRMSDDYFGRFNGTNDQAEMRAKLQMEIDKLVQHFQQVLEQLYLLYKQYGSRDIFFKVSGSEEAVLYRNDPNDIYDIVLSIDTGQGDIEIVQARGKMLAEISRLSQNGRIDQDELAVVLAEMIDPFIADRIVKGEAVAYEKSVSEEQIAISKITSGIGVDVPEEQFNQIRYKTYMEWFMRPDVQQRLQSDQVIYQLAEARAKQWEQQSMQYGTNAQTGRLGTAPTGEIRD